MKAEYISILLSVIVVNAIAISGGMYSRWKPDHVSTPTVSDYDKLVTEMQEGMEALKAERLEMERQDFDTFVSVGALWQAGRELGLVRTPGAPNDGAITTRALKEEEFRKLLARAEQFDDEASRATISVVIVMDSNEARVTSNQGNGER